MRDTIPDAVIIEQANEQLRQERETFNQRKEQAARWFTLRLRMGYGAIVLLPTIGILSAYILVNHSHFPQTVLTGAAGALFVDVLGLVISVWKVVLNPGSVTRLEPVTSERLTKEKLQLMPPRSINRAPDT